MPASQITVENAATVLVVDDEPSIRENLRHTLESAGYKTLLVEDAPGALRALHREKCHLVLLDIEMPGVDGLALCRLLRAQSKTRKVPVIMLSAREDEPSKVDAFAAGADDYVVKPATPRELLLRVESQLEVAWRESALIGSNRELAFLADLGRGLLQALEPEHVLRRVAGAAYESTGANLCAAALASDGEVIACAFDREGVAGGVDLLDVGKLQNWIRHQDSGSATILRKKSEFLVLDKQHTIEYAAPLRFDRQTRGALIVCFDDEGKLGDTEERLVDAAAQQAALASHVARLYKATRDASEFLSREVARRTAEAEAQRLFTEAIIDSLPISLYAVDRTYRIVAWNRNRELGGQGIPKDAAIGRNIFDVLTRQKRDVLEREFKHAFDTGQIERVEHETRDQSGQNRHWLVSKIPMRSGGADVTHVITVGEDITARVEANRAIGRAEKLAAVGRLAAGVVHEINNPLATISACAEALESRVKEGVFDSSEEAGDLREYLGLIRSEAFRCKTITNGLLDFSRTRAHGRVPVDVTELINSTARLVVHQKRGDDVEIRVEAEENLASVLGDEGQLQQAVIALATNAIDAMPNGGCLTLCARNENTRVVIEVSDTGVGISSENLSKIFDPFFTTKELGRGTGLGLAVCYGIVTEHGGRLDVQSILGAGTTFTISLPAAGD